MATCLALLPASNMRWDGVATGRRLFAGPSGAQSSREGRTELPEERGRRLTVPKKTPLRVSRRAASSPRASATDLDPSWYAAKSFWTRGPFLETRMQRVVVEPALIFGIDEPTARWVPC